MDAENCDAARSRLLDSVPSSDGELAAQILAACPRVDAAAGEPYFRSSLPPGTLLIVERGLVILRVAPPPTNRSIIRIERSATEGGFLDRIARALGRAEMFATSGVESDRGWFGVVAGSDADVPTDV